MVGRAVFFLPVVDAYDTSPLPTHPPVLSAGDFRKVVVVSHTVTPIEVSAGAVNELLNTKLLPAIGGEPLDVVMGAMLVVICRSLRPDIADQELVEAIQSIAGFIATALMPVDASTAVN